MKTGKKNYLNYVGNDDRMQRKIDEYLTAINCSLHNTIILTIIKLTF